MNEFFNLNNFYSQFNIVGLQNLVRTQLLLEICNQSAHGHLYTLHYWSCLFNNKESTYAKNEFILNSLLGDFYLELKYGESIKDKLVFVTEHGIRYLREIERQLSVNNEK